MLFNQNTKKADTNLSGSTTWRSPANIALVKYWGKLPGQLSCNDSLSMTLSQSYTETTLEYDGSPAQSECQFYFEGKKQPSFEGKVFNLIGKFKQHADYLKHFSLSINSKNSFPHSSGIASSASSMSALALCFLELEKRVTGISLGEEEFNKQASYWSREGSGSACRSVWGPFSLWKQESQFAQAITGQSIHENFKQMRDAILIVNSGQKKQSSTIGHKLMENHPYAAVRYEVANRRCDRLQRVLEQGDWNEFIQIVEQEALDLHGLMMSSSPGFILMGPQTLAIIESINQFRQKTQVDLCFTLDAGPNVHLLYKDEDKSIVHDFITNKLIGFLENNKWIDDSIGKGPQRIM